MKKQIILFFIFFILLSVTSVFLSTLYAQETQNNTNGQENAIKIFVDGYWELDYLRQELKFANYVRDPKLADVYVLISTQSTGGGGIEYKIYFSGQKQFSSMNDTLTYVSLQSDTEETRRAGVVQKMKLGLIRYAAKTPVSADLRVSYSKTQEEVAEVKDKWNYWVLRTSLNSSLSGEKSFKDYNYNGSFSADRITEDWKIRFSLSSRYNESIFKGDEESFKSINRNTDIRSTFVKSLGDHWSIGLFGNIRSSTSDNTKLSNKIAPALEYNIFPYSMSARREFRITCRIGYENIKYRNETIYDKMSESLANSSLEAVLVVKEKWGEVISVLEGNVYFKDLKKNRFEWVNVIDIRLFQGFSFSIVTVLESIHDQLYLEKGGASYEDLLLRRKELETRYSYHISFGISYTFGSIFNNVVNPRFGN
ncbi:hypothetical protein ACFL4T_02300 [candidate division KSB1 bacterium]